MKCLYLSNKYFKGVKFFQVRIPLVVHGYKFCFTEWVTTTFKFAISSLGFFFTDTDDSQDNRGKEGTIFILLYHFHLLANSQATFISSFAFICRLITRLLLDGIYPPLGIKIWLNISWIVFVDFMLHVIAVIFLRQVVDLNLNRLSL